MKHERHLHGVVWAGFSPSEFDFRVGVLCILIYVASFFPHSLEWRITSSASDESRH